MFVFARVTFESTALSLSLFSLITIQLFMFSWRGHLSSRLLSSACQIVALLAAWMNEWKMSKREEARAPVSLKIRIVKSCAHLSTYICSGQNLEMKAGPGRAEPHSKWNWWIINVWLLQKVVVVPSLWAQICIIWNFNYVIASLAWSFFFIFSLSLFFILSSSHQIIDASLQDSDFPFKMIFRLPPIWSRSWRTWELSIIFSWQPRGWHLVSGLLSLYLAS